MKQLFKNNYITISLVKGALLGIAYDDDQFFIMIGFITFEFQLHIFKGRRHKWEGMRAGKPSSI